MRPPYGKRLLGVGVVTEIRPDDGAQRIDGAEPVGTLWLAGVERMFGLKVGDRGKVYYNHGPKRAWNSFEPEVKS